MSKMTLLEMVQSILSSIEGDEVNSINDTVEASLIADTIKDSYFYLISSHSHPELGSLFTLEGLGDVTRPVFTKIPDKIHKINEIRYEVNSSPIEYKKIGYLEPLEFMSRSLNKNSSSAHVEAIKDFNNITLLIDNNRAPEYWTTFDEKYVVFDSYDSSIESTIQQSKIICYGLLETIWEKEDSFIPNLDSNMFPTLVSEAASMVFLNLKQTSNPKMEQRSRRGQVRAQVTKFKTPKKYLYPNYGR